MCSALQHIQMHITSWLDGWQCWLYTLGHRFPPIHPYLGDKPHSEPSLVPVQYHSNRSQLLPSEEQRNVERGWVNCFEIYSTYFFTLTGVHKPESKGQLQSLKVSSLSLTVYRAPSSMERLLSASVTQGASAIFSKIPPNNSPERVTILFLTIILSKLFEHSGFDFRGGYDINEFSPWLLFPLDSFLWYKGFPCYSGKLNVAFHQREQSMITTHPNLHKCTSALRRVHYVPCVLTFRPGWKTVPL